MGKRIRGTIWAKCSFQNNIIRWYCSTVTWAMIIFLDVVKSRIQADNPLDPKYDGIVDCFRKCYQEGGTKIFFRGFSMMCLRAFPTNAATFLGYEYCMSRCKSLHVD